MLLSAREALDLFPRERGAAERTEGDKEEEAREKKRKREKKELFSCLPPAILSEDAEACKTS